MKSIPGKDVPRWALKGLELGIARALFLEANERFTVERKQEFMGEVRRIIGIMELAVQVQSLLGEVNDAKRESEKTENG